MRFFRRVDQSGFILEPRERALIRAETLDGALLATDVALHVHGDINERIEWWQINHVSFDPEEKKLSIAFENSLIEIDLTSPSLLPETVRERVTATILTSIRFATPGQASAVISLRRRPAANDEEAFVQIDWQGSPTPVAMAEAERRGRLLVESLVFSSPLRLR